mgnify:CR=1 FL=1
MSNIKEVKSKDEKVTNKGYFNQIESNTKNHIKFNNMTLLVAYRGDLEKIKSKLTEKNIDSEIEIRYGKYNFNPARNTAIIYHHEDFKVLRETIIHDSRFNF